MILHASADTTASYKFQTVGGGTFSRFCRAFCSLQASHGKSKLFDNGMVPNQQHVGVAGSLQHTQAARCDVWSEQYVRSMVVSSAQSDTVSEAIIMRP